MKSIVVELRERTRCHHLDLCSFPGSGCVGSSTEGCFKIIEIKEIATKHHCPALPGVNCEIPEYAVLVGKGVPCGEPGKCFVEELFKGLIPPQDFLYGELLPESYKGKRPSRKMLFRILAENGMR
ncbi:MAG: hypothetical protein ACD_56C00050G0002 [uncultured bacterium]|nr:MAG: hypothetical protein ACD_56C00050G0002 [uncultured bacterium]